MCNNNLKKKKKFVFPNKEITTHFLEFQRIKTFKTLHQGVGFQCLHLQFFQLWLLGT